jgi:quercetin dioxygenase-like cupin family protein
LIQEFSMTPTRSASTLAALALLTGTYFGPAAAAEQNSTTQQITRAGEQASMTGPADYFTGRVRVDPLTAVTADLNTSAVYVTFEPGARSAWHTHPAGQYLVVTAGVGRTQEWGKVVQELRPGDVVWCPPGVKHWHGAAPSTAMTHMAITGTKNGNNVNWMEKVSDEQYPAK